MSGWLRTESCVASDEKAKAQFVPSFVHGAPARMKRERKDENRCRQLKSYRLILVVDGVRPQLGKLHRPHRHARDAFLALRGTPLGISMRKADAVVVMNEVRAWLTKVLSEQWRSRCR